ncbi:mycofactocin-coupled SDR family oxidoreductase [Gordonia sp. HNM0687]|uniref:Mycofactocin-coupled SDR family oxidoreductase n=1 Tax=Gordonia mangrovi TaxID=2665643 RepID=A0A6L7GQ06_9ACTN|nr:mycofactocin-coupled SDR family oxidoreductase [Gordonia mangrovi]MXP21437.1 mycofactocin-coupled SDR family oxidoreductase [Gordonia mangrovi]UVF80184.1 mycofactocin-coupled SDR family oxidoreductase [Gordonia mangrovi]
MGRVANKVALITGAARGQGRAEAVRLAEEGADIIAVDICRDVESVSEFYAGATEDDLAQTAELIEKFDRRVVSRIADVRDVDQLTRVVDEGVAELGRLDVIVANAGIFTHQGAAWELTEHDWQTVIDVNLTGVWATIKAGVPHIRAGNRGGSIIITSSNLGIRGSAGTSHYSASKHGVIGLAQSLANELAPESIRVNTLHPTAVRTTMVQNQRTYQLFLPDQGDVSTEDAMSAFQRTNMLPVDLIEPEDVADAVLYLASDESRYVTGSKQFVDAGYLVRH